MPVIADVNPTLLDVAKRVDPDGVIPVIAEMQQKVNPILLDMPFIEGNLQTGHRGVVRSSLPAVAWRLLNQGVTPTKSRTSQVQDTCGRIEAFGEIDEAIYELNGASDAFRMSEDKAFMQAMGIEVANTTFYGDTQADPEEFLGLAPRYNDTTAENGGQIVSAGGSSNDHTSIWLVAWDESTVHGIYPKGTRAGIEFNDLGLETKQNSGTNNELHRVYRSQFIQRVGLHVKDWEAIARVANISATTINSTAGNDTDTPGHPAYTGPNIVDLMVQAYYKIPPRLRMIGRNAFYCNTLVHQALTKLALMAYPISATQGGVGQGNQLTIDQLKEGEPMLKFWGIPVREVEALTITESEVT